MRRLRLEENETLEKRCAEVFLTNKGRMTFHCSLCEDAFGDFSSYQVHLNEVHSPSLKLEFEPIDLLQETIELTQNLEKYLDVELKDFDNRLEDMLTSTGYDAESSTESFAVKKHHSFSRDKRKRGKNKNICKSYILEKFIAQRTKANSARELKIPEEIREVAKRAVYKPQTIAEKDRLHKCPICGFGFKDRGNMVHHFKRHSNERNHACSECDKKFYSNTELTSHKRCHTKERTLLCTECGRMFATKSALSGHLKRHRDQRDYHCQYPGCQKSFYGSYLLKNHMLSHSSERHFSCSMCNASFKRSIALKNHIKLHENKREYKCQLCEAGFNQQAGLFSHLKSAHKSV